MTKCLQCGEAIFGNGFHTAHYSDPTLHTVCAIRMVVGGVNHQLGRCTCCPAGTEPPDPPGLTPFEAALLATTLRMSRDIDNNRSSAKTD